MDGSPTETHRFIADRNTTILVRASAIVQRSDGDDKYAALSREALVRMRPGGSVTFHQQTLTLWDPTTSFTGAALIFDVDATLGAPDRMVVQVKGVPAASGLSLYWQVAVQIAQLDQSIP